MHDLLTARLPAPVSRACQGALAGLWVPLVWLGLRSAVAGVRVDTELATEWAVYTYMLVASMGGFAFFGCMLGLRERRLERMSIRDPLTGLFNTRYVHEQLEQHCEHVRMRGGKLGFLMLDLDHFKAINDHFGHPVGDRMLVQVAHALQASVRPADTVGRVGGEEFVVILPDCDRNCVEKVAERIRWGIGADDLSIGAGECYPMTVSIGATCTENDDAQPSWLYWRADQSLYAAKQAGRDRVQMDENCRASAAKSEKVEGAHDSENRDA